MPIAENVKLGTGIQIFQPDLVNLYGCTVGDETKIGAFVEIQKNVVVGARCKISAYTFICEGVRLEDGVFCGPHSAFTNDKRPRAIKPHGPLKESDDWVLTPTLVRTGASIGAHATIICGVTVGCWAMVGAGAVVPSDVPDFGLAYGNPAQLKGFVCSCGERLQLSETNTTAVGNGIRMQCPRCQEEITVPISDYKRLID